MRNTMGLAVVRLMSMDSLVFMFCCVTNHVYDVCFHWFPFRVAACVNFLYFVYTLPYTPWYGIHVLLEAFILTQICPSYAPFRLFCTLYNIFIPHVPSQPLLTSQWVIGTCVYEQECIYWYHTASFVSCHWDQALGLWNLSILFASFAIHILCHS